eukprot:m.87018 g.87018  ORF g.87018 m.87018 type:complete len:619 (-) comp13086_c0_seq2:107-1963(-)
MSSRDSSARRQKTMTRSREREEAKEAIKAADEQLRAATLKKQSYAEKLDVALKVFTAVYKNTTKDADGSYERPSARRIKPKEWFRDGKYGRFIPESNDQPKPSLWWPSERKTARLSLSQESRGGRIKPPPNSHPPAASPLPKKKPKLASDVKDILAQFQSMKRKIKALPPMLDWNPPDVESLAQTKHISRVSNSETTDTEKLIKKKSSHAGNVTKALEPPTPIKPEIKLTEDDGGSIAFPENPSVKRKRKSIDDSGGGEESGSESSSSSGSSSSSSEDDQPLAKKLKPAADETPVRTPSPSVATPKPVKVDSSKTKSPKKETEGKDINMKSEPKRKASDFETPKDKKIKSEPIPTPSSNRKLGNQNSTSKGALDIKNVAKKEEKVEKALNGKGKRDRETSALNGHAVSPTKKKYPSNYWPRTGKEEMISLIVPVSELAAMDKKEPAESVKKESEAPASKKIEKSVEISLIKLTKDGPVDAFFAKLGNALKQLSDDFQAAKAKSLLKTIRNAREGCLKSDQRGLIACHKVYTLIIFKLLKHMEADTLMLKNSFENGASPDNNKMKIYFSNMQDIIEESQQLNRGHEISKAKEFSHEFCHIRFVLLCNCVFLTKSSSVAL